MYRSNERILFETAICKRHGVIFNQSRNSSASYVNGRDISGACNELMASSILKPAYMIILMKLCMAKIKLS